MPGPNNKSTNHKYAEKHFASHCVAHGAICTPPDSDENGWDFLLEFPSEVPNFTLPSDMLPKPQKAFVQIKSTSTASNHCQIKLSNVLKACQSSLPWFIVFYKLKSSSEVGSIYLLHIGSDQIRAGLKAIRISETQGIELHKKTLRFDFVPEMECQNRLLDKMKQLIKDFGPEYELKKSKLYREVGYEDGYGLGSLTIEARDLKEIERGMLGLGHGLRTPKFSFVPQRFGIPFESGRLEFEHGTLQVQPAPRDCKVVVTGPSGDSLTIDGKIYSTGLPVTDPKAMLIRVSFAGAEAVGTVGSEFTFDASVNPNNTMLIRELRFHSSIRCWSGRGEFDVKIWWEGKPLLAAKMNAKFQESGADWKSFNDLLFFMEGIAGEIGLQTVRISPVQIIDAWRDLNSQRRLTNQQNSFLKFDIGDLSSVKIDEVVCYLKCVVGSFAFCVLLKQRVQSDSMNDAQRILELGPSTLLSKYAVSCEDEDKHSPMEAEYNALLAGTENNRAILFLGDMRGRIF